MILAFGKYKGKEVKDCPSTYLMWLASPTIYDKKTNNIVVFNVSKEIQEEAKSLIDKKLIEENYPLYRFNGLEGEKTEYIIERLGDLSGISIHNSLDEALKQLEIEYPIKTVTEDESWNDHPAGSNIRQTPDPEDDRILIWEVLNSGHKKVVWHFSGWHWDAQEFYGLEQGLLPKDKKSLYSIACEYM